MLKIGLVGAGFMGITHAHAFAKAPDTQIVMVASRTAVKAAAVAKEVDAEATTDFMAVVKDPGVDAVSITLPTNMHKEYVLAALNAGKHVLIEKPMALSVAECDDMIEAAQQSGQILMVAQVLRFWPEYIAMIDFIHAGQLGKPLAAVASRLCEPPRWGEWFLNPEWTGGEVLDLHIHDLDAFNWFFGTPRSVYARGQKGEPGGWDYVQSLVDYGGVCCSGEGSALQPAHYPFTMTLKVLCERGAVEFQMRAGGGQVDSFDAGTNSLIVYETGKDPCKLSVVPGDAYERQAAYFVECIHEKKLPSRGAPEQGRLAVATALAARQSIETGQVVTL